MKNYRQLLKELPSNKVVLAFGQFQPPTAMHELHIKVVKKLAEENDILYNRFPKIFEMHIEGKLDDTFFEMLKLKRKIETGEMTEYDASVMIGQKLFDRYVGPVVNNTAPPAPVKSYAEYYNESTNSTEEGKNNN